MSSTPVLPVALATLGLALALAAPSAHAFRVSAQATAICQGALPAFETAIRKRPLAVQNEGTTDAFVTCAFNNPAASSGISRITGATVLLQNLNGASRSVTCTGVNSSATGDPGPAGYVVRSVQVPASDTTSTPLAFVIADFPGGGIGFPGDTFSVSCSLPPGVGIAGTVLNNSVN